MAESKPPSMKRVNAIRLHTHLVWYTPVFKIHPQERKQFMRKTPVRFLALCLAAIGFIACTGYAPAPKDDTTKALGSPIEESYDLNIPMVTYTWDANAGDKSVSAEMGGPGFTGEGWTTNLTFPAIGSADAVKGGKTVLALSDWPSTLRLAGKEHNNIFSSIVNVDGLNNCQ